MYFSNDGDSRVVRAGKSTLESSQTTEQIFVSSSDAPNTIAALSVNTDSVFVAELPPHGDASKYTIQQIAKATTAVTVLATSDRFSGSVSRIVADDAYFVSASYGMDRLSLMTGEVKPLNLVADAVQIEAGLLYGSFHSSTKNGYLWRVNLATARRQNFLTEYDLIPRSMVEEGGTIFVTLNRNSSTPSMLVRITPGP